MYFLSRYMIEIHLGSSLSIKSRDHTNNAKGRICAPILADKTDPNQNMRLSLVSPSIVEPAR
jgi:hypothetical protein